MRRTEDVDERNWGPGSGRNKGARRKFRVDDQIAACDVLHGEVTINLLEEGETLKPITSATYFPDLEVLSSSTMVVVRVSVINR